MGTAFLTNLETGWHVDQAIVSTTQIFNKNQQPLILTPSQLSEDSRLVVIRFGRASDPGTMVMDELLWKISEKVSNFATTYVVETSKVKDFNAMYELYDPFAVMFFWRNKHVMVDCGTGNNNK